MSRPEQRTRGVPFGKWALGCTALAAAIAVVGDRIADDSTTQSTACHYEVPETDLVWNIAADLNQDENDVRKVSDALKNDNPDIPEGNTVIAGSDLAISDPAICDANEARVTMSDPKE